jgi:hypothetical protein
MRDNIGTDYLDIHLEKRCKACIGDLSKMTREEKRADLENRLVELNIKEAQLNGESETVREDGTAYKAPSEALGATDGHTHETPIEDATLTGPEAPSPILDGPIRPVPSPAYDFSTILEILSVGEKLKDQFMLTEEFKNERRRVLFNTRTFYCRDLVKKNSDGSNNYDDLIEHIKLLEEITKDLKSCKQAAELAKIGMLNIATATERAAIAESDKKYAPKFKDIEKKETEKMTAQEKKIQGFIKLGLSRAMAEKIIFGQA